jgi:hypothetical protein
MNVLITASAELTEKKRGVAHTALKSLLEKYDDANIVTGGSYTHEELAIIASGLGFKKICIFYPYMTKLTARGLTAATNIIIVNLPNAALYMQMIIDCADYIIAIDKSDPIVALAGGSDTKIWFPD